MPWLGGSSVDKKPHQSEIQWLTSTCYYCASVVDRLCTKSLFRCGNDARKNSVLSHPYRTSMRRTLKHPRCRSIDGSKRTPTSSPACPHYVRISVLLLVRRDNLLCYSFTNAGWYPRAHYPNHAQCLQRARSKITNMNMCENRNRDQPFVFI